ncbi:hypothetical protein CORT_0F01580 [Candida orthopsilosis Co 90-125]|uniref:Proline-rich protein HUA1 n=1 Tax=Candida orthopsilosis (strain 90-125) TaxID=1136231 RepID=H8X986_CANO9|nr:hypothetical protein CORT_0F01580 [Candida orthopsilosis Co 90-125]CCG24385.1 hypothetical protein CORT_0F01580 [Candida orthopsilosis Co 90-125]
MGSSSNSNANGSNAAEEEAPPPYEEAVKSGAIPQATTGSSSTTTRPAASRPQRQFHSSTQSYTQSHTQNYSHSYSHSPAPPPGPTAPPTSGGLPFKYPKGFHCRKCDNTGYKLKNGKTCKDCWEKFSPRNSTNSVNYNFHPQHFGSTTFIPYGSAPVPNPHPGGRAGGSGGFFSTAPMVPLRVPPGDPRLGGVLCGRCRGSGMVRFLLDMELCPVCSGLGRVVNMPAGHSSHAPPPQTQAHNPYYGDRKR